MSSKIAVLKHLVTRVDHIIIGGLMLYDALRAMLRARAGKPARLTRRAGTHPWWICLLYTSRCV